MIGGSLVKEARLRAGLTQTELADRLDTTQSVIARWETGAAAPSFDTVVRAVRACDLDLRVELVPYDDHDLGLITQQLARTPAERVEATVRMAEIARVARPATDRG